MREKRKRPGAPRGNQNAKGHGAPKGNQNAKGNRGGRGGPLYNKNAEKTGEYSRILLSAFTEDERAIFEQDLGEPVEQMEQTIKLLAVREYYLLKMRADVSAGGLDDDNATLPTILAVEDALTRVQDKKIKAIAAQQRMLNDKVKIEISGPDAQPIQVQQKQEIDLSGLSKEEIMALVYNVFSEDTDR